MIARFFLVLVLTLSAGIAHADCDTANKYVFSFGDQAAATLAYGNRYTYAARNGGGATQALTMDLAANGLSSTTVNGRTLPEIGTLVTGPDATLRTLTLGGVFSGRTASLSGTTRIITVTLTFAQAVRDVSFTLHDIDYTANQYRDWMQVTGTSGTAQISTPYGTSNQAGGARTAGLSSVVLGAATTPVSITVDQAVGAGSSGNNSDTGNVNVSFAQPVTSVTIKYGSYPTQSGESATGQQAIALSVVSYCPMPRVGITKTSTPYETSGPNRFAVPGADMVYTFTVTNMGGSAVDASTIVLADILPAGITFFGGDFDDTGPGVGAFEFNAASSGLTLPSGGIAYSTNGGQSYGYVAAASYDAAVTAIRLMPTGSFAANSSFTIRFRARVK